MLPLSRGTGGGGSGVEEMGGGGCETQDESWKQEVGVCMRTESDSSKVSIFFSHTVRAWQFTSS